MHVIVSTGPAPVAIPNVQRPDAATTASHQLGQAGLRRCRPISEPSDTVRSGQRHAHRPARRHERVARSAPRSRCSSRPARRRSTVPDVIGQTEAEARGRRSSAKGFERVSTLNQVDAANDGKVVAQNPTRRHAGEPRQQRRAHGRRSAAPATTTTTTDDRPPDRDRGRDRPRRSRAGTRANGRHDLPWRATRDRWPVLVSEVMLHQTQVPRVARRVRRVRRAVPDAGRDRGRGPGRGDRGVGPARLPAPGPLAVGGRGRRSTARRLARRPRRASRGRPLHRGRGRGPGRRRRRVGIEVNIRRVCERVTRRAAVRARGRSRARPRSRRRCAAATGCSR